MEGLRSSPPLALSARPAAGGPVRPRGAFGGGLRGAGRATEQRPGGCRDHRFLRQRRRPGRSAAERQGRLEACGCALGHRQGRDHRPRGGRRPGPARAAVSKAGAARSSSSNAPPASPVRPRGMRSNGATATPSHATSGPADRLPASQHGPRRQRQGPSRDHRNPKRRLGGSQAALIQPGHRHGPMGLCPRPFPTRSSPRAAAAGPTGRAGPPQSRHRARRGSASGRRRSAAPGRL